MIHLLIWRPDPVTWLCPACTSLHLIKFGNLVGFLRHPLAMFRKQAELGLSLGLRCIYINAVSCQSGSAWPRKGVSQRALGVKEDFQLCPWVYDSHSQNKRAQNLILWQTLPIQAGSHLIAGMGERLTWCSKQLRKPFVRFNFDFVGCTPCPLLSA